MSVHRQLVSDTRYLARPLKLACQLVNRGPRWVPHVLRMVPLHVVLLAMRLHVLFRTC